MTEPRKRKTDQPAEPPQPERPALTADVALANAARLLYAAEMDTDRELMGRYNSLGDSWAAVAALLRD